jgi:hypothetical protein
MTRINLSVAVLVGAALLLAGCGGDSSSPSVAHLSSSTSSDSNANGGDSSSSPESSASVQRKMVAFAQCMRSHGVPEFPDPTEGKLLIHSSDHNGHVSGVNPRSAQFLAAQKACAKFMPAGLRPSPAQTAKLQESALKFSQCMRSHGVPNFPDPKFSSGGVSVRIGGKGGAGAIDPNSPQFKAAQKACQSLGLGPKGPPGGPATSNSSSGPEQSSGEAIAP